MRAVAIGIIMVLLTVWLVTYAELVSGQIMIGYLQAPPVAVFLLLVVTGANLAVRKVNPNRALAAPEMATIYAMMVPAAMVASHGMLQRILPVAVAGNYFASKSNAWATTYFPHTPAALVIWNPHGPAKQAVATSFYDSLKRGGSVPWGAWIRPLASWIGLFAMVYGAFLAMAAILRKQWVDNERLTFPLVQLPLELIDNRSQMSGEPGGQASVMSVGAFFTSPLAWLGFAVPFTVFAINGFHHIWPTIPQIPLMFPLNSLLTTPPWHDISYFTCNISFAAIGFFFLLPTEILFSMWFFFLLGKVQEIAFSAAGNKLGSSPHADAELMIGAQAEGAWIALAFAYFALAKPHLKAVWRAVISRKAVDKGEGEMLSYRSAFWLLVVCCVGIVLWCVRMGMSAWLAMMVFGLYIFVQALIMARSTAEGGMIMTEGCWTPSDIIGLGIPMHSLGPSNLTILSYIDATFTRDLRSILLTALLDMQKLADAVQLKLRSLRGALLTALVVAVVFGCVLQIWLPYHKGANAMYPYMYTSNPTQFFQEYAPAMKPGPPPPSYGALWYAIIGAGVTVALTLLRARVGWWPLHPLGYALTGSWTVVVFWMSMLIAWVIKSSILHYGGIKLYRRIRPLFIGMILGELSAAAVWTLVSAVSPISAPQFPWP